MTLFGVASDASSSSGWWYCFYPFWRICAKAGFPGVVSLLLFVPLVNFIFLWVAALSEWPIERQLRDLKARAGVPTG